MARNVLIDNFSLVLGGNLVPANGMVTKPFPAPGMLPVDSIKILPRAQNENIFLVSAVAGQDEIHVTFANTSSEDLQTSEDVYLIETIRPA